MAELIFPPDETQAADQKPVAYEFGPQTTPYATDNGLTYTYDPTKNAWVLKTGVAVTQDDLEIRMKEKIDKTGGIIFGGDSSLIFSETPYTSTPDRLEFRVDGQILMRSDNKKIIFHDTSTKGGAAFYVDGNTDDNKYLEFATIGLVSNKRLNFSSTSDDILISHTHTGQGEVVFADLNSDSSHSGNNVVKVSTQSKLHIRGGDVTMIDIDFRDQGSVTITPFDDGLETFVVKQKNHDINVLQVDTDTHKLYSSSDYNKGLIAGNDGYNLNSTTGQVAYTEDNLLATVGFVKEGFFKPGMNVFANSEDAAEVGGLWTDGYNYYIKVRGDTT